jgi:hypothetical protein
MVMVENPADTPAGAFGDFASALAGADSDILASFGATFADIAGGFHWMQCNQVTGTLPNTFGRRSRALGGSFADVTGAVTDVSTRAGWMRLLRSGRLRCAGRLRCGLGLAGLSGRTLVGGVLAGGILAANGECECEERDG